MVYEVLQSATSPLSVLMHVWASAELDLHSAEHRALAEFVTFSSGIGLSAAGELNAALLTELFRLAFALIADTKPHALVNDAAAVDTLCFAYGYALRLVAAAYIGGATDFKFNDALTLAQLNELLHDELRGVLEETHDVWAPAARSNAHAILLASLEVRLQYAPAAPMVRDAIALQAGRRFSARRSDAHTSADLVVAFALGRIEREGIEPAKLVQDALAKASMEWSNAGRGDYTLVEGSLNQFGAAKLVQAEYGAGSALAFDF